MNSENQLVILTETVSIVATVEFYKNSTVAKFATVQTDDKKRKINFIAFEG